VDFTQINPQLGLPLALATSVVAILYGVVTSFRIVSNSAGTEKMKEIADAIAEGSSAYLTRQYSVVSIVAVIIFAAVWYFLAFETAIGFLIGAAASAASGFIGMNISVRANVRTTEAAKSGLAKALSISFAGGSVTGLLVVGLALLAVTGFYGATGSLTGLVGLGFGGSLISIFARLGGGIFTKGADVGADLVGKTEANIPEDDPRNPATIADAVGDNVGDCAGMAADLFETYAITLIAAMLLGSLIFSDSLNVLLYPLSLGAVAIIATIIATFFVKLPKSKNIMAALYAGLFAAAVISAITFFKDKAILKYFVAKVRFEQLKYMEKNDGLEQGRTYLAKIDAFYDQIEKNLIESINDMEFSSLSLEGQTLLFIIYKNT